MEYTKTRLRDICTTNQDSYSDKELWSFINYLDTGNITNNTIDDIQYFSITGDKYPSRAKRKVKIDDIIYSTVRPNQRHFGIIKQIPDNFLVSTGFVVISVNPKIADADYVYFYLTQDAIVENLHSLAEQSTSTYPSIRPSDIENITIDLPPIDIQKSISKILKILNGKIEVNNKINDNLSYILT